MIKIYTSYSYKISSVVATKLCFVYLVEAVYRYTTASERVGVDRNDWRVHPVVLVYEIVLGTDETQPLVDAINK